MASSILKWVVSHQSYHSKLKSKSKKEEAKSADPSPEKGTPLWGVESTVKVFSWQGRVSMADGQGGDTNASGSSLILTAYLLF